MNQNEIAALLGVEPSPVCINCGKPNDTDKIICSECEVAALRLERLLQQGIEVEYDDGTKEILRTPRRVRPKRRRYGQGKHT